MSQEAATLSDSQHSPSGVIDCRGLGKQYGTREALVDLTLSIPSGACYGILGPNGSGKTTFLKLVCGLFRPTTGTLEVCGHPMPQRGEQVRARLGVLLDQPLVPRHLPLSKVLQYVNDLHGGTISSQRIESLIERVGLTWRRRDPITTFSRGMAQRASLACALLHDPEVLILDEPFTGLDRAGCRLVETIIEEFVAAGRTVLLVTHESSRAERLCDVVTWFQRGRLEKTLSRGDWSRRDFEGDA